MGAEKESALDGHARDGTAAAGQVWSPLFYGGEKKEEQLLSKRGRGKCFCRRRKNGMTPFPRGGNRAKIGGKTETRETFLWISKKDWDG